MLYYSMTSGIDFYPYRVTLMRSPNMCTSMEDWCDINVGKYRTDWNCEFVNAELIDQSGKFVLEYTYYFEFAQEEDAIMFKLCHVL